jgi:hypothetical protein
MPPIDYDKAGDLLTATNPDHIDYTQPGEPLLPAAPDNINFAARSEPLAPSAPGSIDFASKGDSLRPSAPGEIDFTNPGDPLRPASSGNIDFTRSGEPLRQVTVRSGGSSDEARQPQAQEAASTSDEPPTHAPSTASISSVDSRSTTEVAPILRRFGVGDLIPSDIPFPATQAGRTDIHSSDSPRTFSSFMERLRSGDKLTVDDVMSLPFSEALPIILGANWLSATGLLASPWRD